MGIKEIFRKFSTLSSLFSLIFLSFVNTFCCNKGIRTFFMVSDGVTTRSQKEVSQLRQEFSKLQTDLDRKLKSHLASFQEDFRAKLKTQMKALFKQYLGKSNPPDKGKGILRDALLGFLPVGPIPRVSFIPLYDMGSSWWASCFQVGLSQARWLVGQDGVIL